MISKLGAQVFTFKWVFVGPDIIVVRTESAECVWIFGPVLFTLCFYTVEVFWLCQKEALSVVMFGYVVENYQNDC